MPGIIGFYGVPDPIESANLLGRMARALEPEERFAAELYQEEQIALGRVSLRISNPQPQPVWNEDHTICLAFEGELYDYQKHKTRLQQAGHRFASDDPAEVALHLYEQQGDHFASELNGAFAMSIWDRRDRSLRAINDRLGLYPLYYAQYANKIAFASGVRAILADPDCPHSVDQVAIEEFLTFDHLLGDRTFVEQIRLLPQATILKIVDGRLSKERYYDLRYPSQYELRSESEVVEELIAVLRKAVARQANDDQPLAVLLSGGLDSRVILAFLNDLPARGNLHTFTFGVPGCDDARFAQEISSHTRAQHHFFELKPDYLLEHAENGVRITDGHGNIVNLHALATVREESEISKIIYKGFLGDAMMGFALRHQHWAEYDEETSIRAHLQVHSDQGVINYTPAEKQALFTPAFQQKTSGLLYREYRQGMLASGSRLLADQRLYFDFTQRVPRMTINGVEVARSHAIIRLPFADNDLIEFSLKVHPGLKVDRRMMRLAFIQAYPALAQIPFTDTGLPMMACAREIRLRAQKFIRWHLHARGLGKHPDQLRKPYKDYKNWFRGVLKNWLESILLSERHLQRGYFQPEMIRTLVAEHMAGKDHTVRLGALLSVELWHRQFFD